MFSVAALRWGSDGETMRCDVVPWDGWMGKGEQGFWTSQEKMRRRRLVVLAFPRSDGFYEEDGIGDGSGCGRVKVR